MQEDLFATPAEPPRPTSGTVQGKPGQQRKNQGVLASPSVAQWAELAARLPAELRFGASTWSYPGWDGLVWDGVYDASQLSRKGLEAYCQHPLLRSICVDRSFWQPLTASQYAAYAAQVDGDFRFVIKCPAAVTDAQVRSEQGQGRALNPAFLQPDLALSCFVEPAVQGLGSKLGVLVFQLSPLTWGLLSRLGELMGRLQTMLAAVRQTLDGNSASSHVIVALEVRDPELMTPALAQMLRSTGCTYCLGLHGKMPPIEEQLPLLRALWPGPLVCRWNLNRIFGAYGYADAQKKHEPFSEIRSPDPHTRAVLARTIAGITRAGQPAFVTVSNDAEGCAPRSIALLAQAVADAG
ncbi:DUF72 domain-containing protein [Comamonas composti]|uniref:DUF72 domain-containing protein n=1 Tax=Comamonas composti TaxID=408558 RepID=UPI000404FE58|nr:DUF72 domain-containing protein [Comamonas composti]